MTAIGTIAIKISPFEARLIAVWLRSEPPPLFELLRLNMPTLRNQNRVDLVKRLEAVASRKRSSGSYKQVELRLDRDDAAWFAGKVAGGMFGGRWRILMPQLVRSFCLRCAYALRQRPGRKVLQGDRLRSAVERSTLDERHRKRLRKRLRGEQGVKARGLGSAMGLVD